MLLAELTVADVRAFLDDMFANNSRAMTVKALGSLRSLISDAQERGLVTHNVARDVKLKRQRRVEKERIVPTKNEIRALITSVSDRHKPLVVTAIFTGMRSSELRGLTWDNVYLDRKIIHVRKRADRWNVLGSPKSRAGRRDIPMAPMVHDILWDWRKACPKGPQDLVFPNGAGNVESHANICHRVFKPLMLECGIINGSGKPKFSIHSLRHAAASLFIEQGWSPKKIQTILGHSSITMTFDVYGHLFSDAEGDMELMAKVQRDLLAA